MSNLIDEEALEIVSLEVTRVREYERDIITAYERAKATIRESRKVEPQPELPKKIPEDCQNFNIGWYINSIIDWAHSVNAALYEGRK